MEFTWAPGLSLIQKHRSIASLHERAESVLDLNNLLEVSTKSPNPIGVNLSAFSLIIQHPEFGSIPLESAFQGSKVFEKHGAQTVLYQTTPRIAKQTTQEINLSDKLTGFQWNGTEWPLTPESWFYDWLYLTSVIQTDRRLLAYIRRFDGFTDIEFNPKKSVNCQARSCAIIASTTSDAQLEKLISDPESMVEDYVNRNRCHASQQSLFDAT